MKLVSFWKNLWKRVHIQSPSPFATNTPSEERSNAASQVPRRRLSLEGEATNDELWLQTLLANTIEGTRRTEIGTSTFWMHIESLQTRGDERLACQWIEKFLTVSDIEDAVAHEMRLRLIHIAEERGDLQSVLAHLYILRDIPQHACDAHYYLAEYHNRRGEEIMALREYEAVLAIRVDYPNVRQRCNRLRAARGHRQPAAGHATMVGPSSTYAGDRYRLIQEIGRGAAGVVYLARDVQLEREVAIKLLHPHLAAVNQQQALQTFFAEARIAASLRHPNIVSVLDLDEKARRIVMELCNGGTLRTVLRDNGPRPLLRALERHAQILSALDSSHARGVVHRDLKPANLMFRRPPDAPGSEVVLGDFGIAHLPDANGQTGEHRAMEEQTVGTIAYMAPEQRRGQVTPRSDVYASAVVLFEMLTGRYPWSHDQLLAGVRGSNDFALPRTLFNEQPELSTLLQTHLNAIGAPAARHRPDTTDAMKTARHLRDLAIVCCRDINPKDVSSSW